LQARSSGSGLYYTALVENEEYSPIRPLVDWLDYNGYAWSQNRPRNSRTPLAAEDQGQHGHRACIDVMEMCEQLTIS
jgi:hypothetical protein